MVCTHSYILGAYSFSNLGFAPILICQDRQGYVREAPRKDIHFGAKGGRNRWYHMMRGVSMAGCLLDTGGYTECASS